MLPSSVRVFLCAAPQDMRRSFDVLAALAGQVVGEDPRSGALFVFVNKRRDRAKVLWWERNGYCLLYKRLHRALFRVPEVGGAASMRLDARTLAALLEGIAHERRRTQKEAKAA
jgi:transposase